MKHKGEMEVHVLRWLQEGYTIEGIKEEGNKAITRFESMKHEHYVDWTYEV